MNQRAYGQIVWRGPRVGLHLVNQDNESFFLYPEPLMALSEDASVYTLVKRRDRRPERAIGYHPGAVYATLEEDGDDSILTLLLFEAENRQPFNAEGEIQGVHFDQVYRLPKPELAAFISCLKTMVIQHREFKMLQSKADSQGIF